MLDLTGVKSGAVIFTAQLILKADIEAI